MSNPRYPQDSVVYADCAFCSTSAGVAAGVELRKRTSGEDGRLIYEPVRVFSLLYPSLPSVRQAINTVAAEVLRNLDDDTRLVVFRSASPHFQKNRSIEEAAGPYAVQAGVEIRIHHKPERRIYTHPMLLANDAIERGHSLIAEV